MSEDMVKATIKVKPGSELSFWFALNYRQLRFMDMEASLLQQDQKLRAKWEKLSKVESASIALFVVGGVIGIIFSLLVLQIVFSAAFVISYIIITALKDLNLKKRKRVLEHIKDVAEMIEQERQGQSPLAKWNYRY